jgi:transcriptional regulator with XRE-family HTH domain
MQFSLRFKQLCKENGVTQQKALAEMGLHRNAAQRWCEGSPSTEALIKIADYFGITTDEVLGVANKKMLTPNNGSERAYSDIELAEAFMRADDATREAIRLLLKLK